MRKQNKERLLEQRIRELEKEVLSAIEIKRNTKPFHIRSVRKLSKGEVTPIVLLSDFHYEEEVKKQTVNGMNEYNLDIARQRVISVFKNTLRLIEKERHESKMDGIVLALLGDFISGAIHEPLLPLCKLQPMQAILEVQELLIGGIEMLRRETKLPIYIPCVVGNHSRTTKKVWIATEQGFSLEYLMYKNMENYFKRDPNVHFVVSESQHCYIKVYDRSLRFLHGTQFLYNGGVGGFTIPVNKKIKIWNNAMPCYYTFAGHLHQHFDGNPNFLINGSLIGYNTFALSIGAEFQKPCMSMTMLSKKWGKVGVSPIFTDI